MGARVFTRAGGSVVALAGRPKLPLLLLLRRHRVSGYRAARPHHDGAPGPAGCGRRRSSLTAAHVGLRDAASHRHGEQRGHKQDRAWYGDHGSVPFIMIISRLTVRAQTTIPRGVRPAIAS